MSVPVALPVPVTLTASERLSGHAAVVAARLLLTVTRGRPAPLVTVLRIAQRGTRPATMAHAQRARAIVETVSLRCASHHGCLLRSLAILLLCRWRGRHVTWRVGVCSPPPMSHAWVEAAGQSVGEPFDPCLLYTPIITVRPGRIALR
ncbi:MAG: lasso peptide biosynthesis B2 protein [Pseudonocardiaceae bacterium]